MNFFENSLGYVSTGRVLDVATQEGGFVQILTKHLRDYTSIIGMDIDPRAVLKAKETLVDDYLQFLVMDAACLGFNDVSFDMVCISASMHHLENPLKVLGEMERVLKPGGLFILIEMHSSGQTEPQLTTIYLHQWVAEVDTALGKLHNPTFPRLALLDCIKSLKLEDIQDFDKKNENFNPMDSQLIRQLDSLIESTIDRASALEERHKLIEKGNTLRSRLHSIGASPEPIVLFIARKVGGVKGW
jgi:ubiquinone/menaquinone biosynthesis C-methylase UbiE